MTPIKIALTASILLTCTLATAVEPPKALYDKFSQMGNIKEVQSTQTSGMFAWLLEKNGKTLVLYNTPDGKAFIKGTIYDINSKKILSDQHAISSLKYASPEFKQRVLGVVDNTVTQTSATTPIDGYMNLKWSGGKTPEAIEFIESLAGVREGKGAPEDTLYVIYDPRCVWCHKTYDGIREYVNKGYTIKWLPTVALGRNDEALALAAAPLQNKKLLNASFRKSTEAKSIKPTEKSIQQIDKNLQFLFAYFEKVIPDQQPSVPLALFLNKTDGKLTHLQGLPDRVVFDVLYGERK